MRRAKIFRRVAGDGGLEFVQHTTIGETSHKKAAVELLWIQRFTLGPEVASSGFQITANEENDTCPLTRPRTQPG